MDRYIFPRWSNRVLPFVFFFILGPASTAAVAGMWYYATNKNVAVGFEPVQPVEYSHKLHAGDMGIDCRYCHFTAERSYFAAVPPTETCMNCHWKVRTDSLKLLPVRESYALDKPITVGPRAQPARLRLLQSRRPPGCRRGLLVMPRPDRPDAAGQAGEAALDELVPRLPPRRGAQHPRLV